MQSQPRNPVSDIICPDSEASISIGSSRGGRGTTDDASTRGGRSSEDLLGPIGSELGLDSDMDSLPSPSVMNAASSSFELSEKDQQLAIREADLLTLSATPPLDLCWDLLCDVETFQVSP